MNRTRRAVIGISILWGSIFLIDTFVHRDMAGRLLRVGAVQAVSLAFYCLGAALVLSAVGAAIDWRVLGSFDLREFEPSAHPAYRVGLWMNRIASVVPPSYLLVIGWRALPWYVSLWNVFDIGTALAVAVLVTPIVRSLHRDAKSPSGQAPPV